MNCRHWVMGLSLALVAAEGAANEVKKLEIDAHQGMEGAPRIVVYSTDGESWNKVDTSESTRVSFRLNAHCKYEGKGNKAYQGSMSVHGFTAVGDTDPADFLIPHADSASGNFRYNDGNQEINPRKICADELQKRLSEHPDRTRYHILAEGLSVDYPAAVTAGYQLICNPTGLGFADIKSKSIKINARIKCQKSALAEAKIPKPVPKAVPAKLVPLVKAVSFVADPADWNGACPVSVAFRGKITATRSGTVKYRYVDQDGNSSPEFSLAFEKAGTRATRKWFTTANKPKKDPGATLSSGGGATAKWDFTGWQRIEILAPAPGGSVTAKYRGKCVDGVQRAVVKPLVR